MKRSCLLLAAILYVSVTTARAADIERWTRLEISLKGPQSGNPFTDLWLKAEFTRNDKKYTVNGFYNGEGNYSIRFMPGETGQWSYTTSSNNKELNGKKGSFNCKNASAGNHGPVVVSNTYHFRYADGKQYYPFGTTIYAFTHQGDALEEQTLETLRQAPFNKVRMCVFPKFYTHAENEPVYYPYIQAGTTKDAAGKEKKKWDFTRFNPAFFTHLEKRIDQLNKLGIEADIIIFHPYDRGHWGFDSMGMKADLQYLSYLTARLASFRNVWWSMANEYDYVKTKSREAWDVYARAVVQGDPYHHLCSIHNGSVYYEHWKPEFTHVSIQNGSAVEDFGRAALLKDVYFKPVIYDEVCYEGDLPLRWGRLTGEEMTHAFWQGVLAGTYVTHGETYQNKEDIVFWARGGKFVGQSPARIGFLRKIMEQGPGPLRLADEWKDHQTAQTDSSYYLIYFGRQMQNEWTFNLPKKNAAVRGAKYKVDVLDTWDMTITPVAETFETAEPNGYRIYDKQMKKIRLPMKPYIALRITMIR